MRHPWPLSSWCSALSQRLPSWSTDSETRSTPCSPPTHQQSDETRRLALILEYDGNRYRGFQWQATAPTVQGELERALNKFTGETTRVRAASRTDAGVHARGQVVDFLTQAPHKTETFVKALNWHLPSDIRVRGAYQTSSGFNSRKDAISRTYRYTLLNARWPSALLRAVSHWVSSPLDVARMREAGGYLVGTHDFSPFTVLLPAGRSPVRQVERWDVWREKELVLIEAEAVGFLRHQIRRANGILVKIGLGRLPVDVIKGIIDGGMEKPPNFPSLPAKGLCLMKVNYPDFALVLDNDYETT